MSYMQNLTQQARNPPPAGKSTLAIAKELSRYHATIGRELRRNTTEYPYCTKTSQEGYVQRRNASVSAGKWNPELASRIEEKLQAT